MAIIASFSIFYTSREAASLAPCITNHISLSHNYRITHPFFPSLNLKKKKRKMEDQLERENSPEAFDAEDGGGSSSTETNSATLERLREILEHRESTIEDLRQTVAILKHNIEEQRDEIIRLKSLNSNIHKPQNSSISLPFELIKMIFYLCDALTRCRICCINKRLATELSSWVDVQHLYLTRVPIEDEANKTVVIHAYQAVTNSPAVGVIRTTKAIPMLYNFRLVYTLSDFLTLPNLRTLHIRETLTLADVPPVDKICAPIEDLRICTHRMRIRQLLTICRALATTLRRLELLLTVIVPEGAATSENRSAAVIEVAETMITMKHLSHLTLARAFLKVKRIVVTESIKIDPSWYPLNSVSMEFFDVFNDERMPILQDVCRKVRREITFQLGRLRGFGSATVNFQLSLVRILANKMLPLRFGSRRNDCRVFLWKGRILTRREYLKMNDINIDGIM
ncbi:Uncharacterized protein BM_BM8414 [Brugia malayi]|uniref:Bm8414, isoform a n=1 Tax=Brugia malayi TaxID=6279 RepID=A0A0R3RF53_BRUMA|nr:Uncharacterized protein BM_BM8414 [Brugia malayi]CRZ22290.1 Bm8414, isoform a [Brugia malayi]VIP00044.1 Uncharacterized protein BM_BM8414 [Brugia malayi]